jgi:hypothetical protein
MLCYKYLKVSKIGWTFKLSFNAAVLEFFVWATILAIFSNIGLINFSLSVPTCHRLTLKHSTGL